MIYKKNMSLAIMIVLAILAVTGCGTSKSTPASSIDPSVCPTSQPQSCPTAPAVQAPTNPTLTFNDAGDQCTYSGPDTVPYGKFTVDVVPGHYSEGYDIGYVIVMLIEGKTIDDLNAYTASDPPSWVSILFDGGPIQQNMSVPHDVRSMTNYTKGEPIYFVCFYGDSRQQSKIGAIGPIEVKE